MCGGLHFNPISQRPGVAMWRGCACISMLARTLVGVFALYTKERLRTQYASQMKSITVNAHL